MRIALCVLFSVVNVFAAVYDITEYGAKGDKETNDAPYIQAAIDACHESGGGTVYVPAGDFLTGSLRLKDHVSIDLACGATLWVSRDPDHFPEKNRGVLFLANGASHISIVGEGRIHGQGTADYGRRKDVEYEPLSFRTGIFLLQECDFVTIRDIKIEYSDAWTIHLKRCQRVLIDGVYIFNNMLRVNSDGIDPNSCRDVRISNCHIVAGDDCIVLKSTEPYPCENIVVNNCILESTSAALKIGTESHGDFRDIHFSNITIPKARIGCGFNLKDGATIERITFSDISIQSSQPEWIRQNAYPIHMDIEKRNKDSKIGMIRDVSFSNIQIFTDSKILIQGMPESPLENISFDHITLRITNPRDFSDYHKHVGGRRSTSGIRDTLYARQPNYMTFAHIKGLSLSHISILADRKDQPASENKGLSAHHVKNLSTQNLYVDPHLVNMAGPWYRLEDCELVNGF